MQFASQYVARPLASLKTARQEERVAPTDRAAYRASRCRLLWGRVVPKCKHLTYWMRETGDDPGG